jgi:hypothetical protein
MRILETVALFIRFVPMWYQTVLFYYAFMHILLGVSVGIRSVRSNPDQKDCLGPPYLYATTHNEVPNVLKFSRDGCLLQRNVLKGGPLFTEEDHYIELRSIIIGQHNGSENMLYVADAMTHDSAILIYGQCDKNGLRSYVNTVVSTFTNPGADHGYGICFDNHNNIYASFQHTDVVLRFHKDTFVPMPLPPALRDYHKWRSFYPGSFAQFGNPGAHHTWEQGIRSIVYVNGNLWMANKDLNGIAIAAIDTGIIHNIVVVYHPIGLHYDPISQLIFVSSKHKHWRGAVYSIDPNSMRIKDTYTTHRMNHPTGIVTYDNMLYVAELSQGMILQFDISTKKYIRNIVEHAPGELEQLALSSC